MANEEIRIDADTSGAMRAFTQLNKELNKLATNAEGPASKSILSFEKALNNAAAKSNIFEQTQKQTGNAFKSLDTAAEKYKQTLKELSRAEGAQKTSSGAYRGNDGKFLATDDVKRYEQALKGLNAVEAERVRLLTAANKVQSQTPMRATMPTGYQSPDLLKIPGTTSVNLGDSMKIDTSPARVEMGKLQETAGRLKTAFMDAGNSVRYVMYDVSNSMAIAGAATAALGVASLATAVKWESSFAAVRRTVGGTDAEMNNLYDTLRTMSTEIPVAFSQLSEIASLGGQLGISSGGIASFTETVAKLTATTSLTADSAGTALGRFKSFFAEVKGGDQSLAVTQNTFTNLASSILKVGVNSVATETGIVAVATQISSMGSYAGLTANQVIGLAGALSSVGVPPELSRGVITRLFNEIGEAVSVGGKDMVEFARVSGMSSADFAASWGTADFGNTIMKFMTGLKNEGDQAVFTLHNLGVTSVRDVPVLLRLASAANSAGEAGGLLAQTMGDAASGWSENTELALQYAIIAETTGARITVLGQAFEALFATIGSAGTGPLKVLVDTLIQIVNGVTAIAATPIGQIFSGAVIGASLLVGALFLLVSGLARATAMALGFKQAMDSVTISAGVAATATKVFNIALVTTGIGAVVVALGTLVGAFMAFNAGAESSHGAIKDTQGLLQAMRSDTDSGRIAFASFNDGLKKVKPAASATATEAKRLNEILNGTKGSGKDAATGLKDAADGAEDATLKFGQAAIDFVKSQLLLDEGFKEAASSDAFTEYWDMIGANTDDAIKAAAKNGKEGVEEYFWELEQEFTKGSDKFKMLNGGIASNEGVEIGGVHGMGNEVSEQVDKYVNSIGGVQAAAKAAAAEQRILNGSVQSYTDANELAAMSTDDLVAANEEAVAAMSKGIAKFADTGGMISETQGRLKEAAQASADAYKASLEGTDTALDSSKDSWDDYYNGISFSLEDYLVTFRAAAAEQKTFTDNLTALSAAGLSSDIIRELAELGPEAAPLVQSLVDGTDAQLKEFESLWGRSGANAAEKYAASLMAADIILKNAGKHLGEETRLAMLNEISAGREPLVDILKKYNLDAAGNPIKVKGDTGPAVDSIREYQRWLRTQTGDLRVNASISNMAALESALNAQGFTTRGSNGNQRVNAGQFYSGGYTGNGTKYQPRGVVHAGEFVMTKEATAKIGVGNLYAQMRQAQGGVKAPTSAGYYNGGAVNGGGFATIDAQSLQAILALGNRPIYLYSDDRLLAEANARGAVGQTVIGSN